MHRILTMAGLAALLFVTPAAVQAQVAYYPPRVVVSSYYAPAPVVSYYAPAPVVAYYAPAPVVSYYTPAPVVSYYAAAPVTGYYATTTTYVAPRVFRPRVYVSSYYTPVYGR